MTPELTRRTFFGALLLTGGGYATSQYPADPTETTRPTPGTWPAPRYDAANTATNPHAEIRDNPSIDWRTSLDVGHLVVGRDHVFVGGDRLSALGRETGELVWQRTPLGGVEHLAVRDGLVYHSGGEVRNSHVRAVDAQTGDLRWGLQPPAVWDAVLADRELVLSCSEFGSSESDRLLAIDLATGERRWEWTEGAHAGLAAADGHLYGMNGHLTRHAARDLLDTVTNAGPDRDWVVDRTTSVRRPVIADGRVLTAGVVASRTKRPEPPTTAGPNWSPSSSQSEHPPIPALAAHDPASGNRLWGALWSDSVPFRAGTRYGIEQLAAAHGRVYAGLTVDNREEQREPGRHPALVTYAAEDGTREWTARFYQEPDRSTGVTALGVTSEYVILAHRPLDEPDSTSPHPPTVRALDPADGMEQWRIELPEKAHALAIAGDTVFAATANGPVSIQ